MWLNKGTLKLIEGFRAIFEIFMIEMYLETSLDLY